MAIPSISLDNLINKFLKILTGENSPLIPLGLKNQFQSGNILQGEVVKIFSKGKAAILIEGQKVIAELPDVRVKPQENARTIQAEYPFKSGQKIYMQVEKVNPEPVLKLVSVPNQNFKEEGYKTNFSRNIETEIIKFENVSELKLTPDKPVRVTINQVKNKNGFTFKIDGKEILVNTDKTNSYRVGDTVHVQFKRVNKGFKPILIDHPENGKKIDLEFIKSYLPSRKPLGNLVGELTQDVLRSPVLKELNINPELVERLRTTLSDLTPKPDVIPDELEIKRQIDKSGIRYESKIKQFLTQPKNTKIKIELARDLKGQLLELIQTTHKPVNNYSEKHQPQQISALQKCIKIALDSIELNQLSSRISKQENQPLVLQIPNPLSSNNKTIQLFIREDSGSKKNERKAEKEFYSLAFFLDLSSLGKIKIKAKVGSNHLTVRMEVGQDDVANYIRKNVENFEYRMKNKNLNTNVECCVTEEIDSIKDNLIELFVNNNTPLLSVKT